VVCPNCGFNGAKGTECVNCGIIFKKFIEQKKKVATNIEDSPKTHDSGRKKIIMIMKGWLFFSILYLIIVTIYLMVVFQTNERFRPKRDRLYATYDFIEYSHLKEQVEWIKKNLEMMIDRRERKSKIYGYFEEFCKSLERDVKIRKSNAMIKASFKNGLILKFVNINSSVYIKEPEIPGKQYFKSFPKLSELHFLDRDNDYDRLVSNLHEQNDHLDFALIEHRFMQSMKWLVPRFILFALLLWITPVSLSFLAVCFISRTQTA
jgi:hypothetical protein